MSNITLNSFYCFQNDLKIFENQSKVCYYKYINKNSILFLYARRNKLCKQTFARGGVLNKTPLKKIKKMNVLIFFLVALSLFSIVTFTSYALFTSEVEGSNSISLTVSTAGRISVRIFAQDTETDVSTLEKHENKLYFNVKEGYEMESFSCDTGEATYDRKTNILTIKNATQNGKCDIKYRKITIYGIRRLLNSKLSSWERIEDSIGSEANAQVGTTTVKNDFDSIAPWSEIISYNYNTSTKQITATYGDSNFKFDGSNGEVLTKIPEFYWKRYRDSNYEYILISKSNIDGYTKSEEFSVGRYTMSGSSEGVHSKSGATPLVSTTIADFRTYARNLGTGFGQMDWHYFILQMLYLVEYADYDSQAKLGPGNTNASHTTAITSGGCDFLGMKSGSADGTDTSSIIYRGIEDIYGNIWQFVDGINIRNGQTYICYDQSQYTSDKFNECYKAIGYTNVTSNGYVSKLGYDAANPMVAFPTEINETTGIIGDYSYSLASGDRTALVGARYSLGFRAGLWSWYYRHESSVSGDSIGARLLKTS